MRRKWIRSRNDNQSMSDPLKKDPVDVVRGGYEALSRRYRADNDEPTEYATWITDLLAELRPGSRVLDVGCGCGVPVARALAAAGHQITGVDLSPVQVERAIGLVPGARFLCADVTTLSLPHESFDAIVALYSIIHIPLSAQPDVLAAMAEWLVDDGLLLLTAGASAWTGSEAGWLGGDADMWWSHADAATYRGWLADSCLGVISEDFVPEGTSGHSLFWARRQPRVR